MSSKIYGYYGIDKLPEETRKFISKFIGFSQLSSFAMLLSSTFYVLFIIDLVDYAQAGVLISIGFIIQAVVDYPTGVFADWLSYRIVLVASYIGHFLSFLALTFINEVPKDFQFEFLVAIYCLEAFSLAQESGALQSYYDNNYKVIAGDLDPEKTQYKEIYGKNLMFFRLFGGLSIYFGGFLAVSIGRRAVFLIQALFTLSLAILFFLYLKEPAKTENAKLKAYWAKLKTGFLLIFKTKVMFFYSLTFVLIMTVNRIWIGLLVFPIYFGYTGSDSLASLLRGSLFILGSVITGLSTKISKNLKNKHLPILFLLHTFLVYGAYSLFLFIYPIHLDQSNAEFNIIAIAFIVIIAAYGNFSTGALLTVTQKIMLDIIPDENRNSYYSLLPTLTLFLSSFFIIGVSQYLQSSESFGRTVMIFIFTPVMICTLLSYLTIKFLEIKND